MKITYQHGHVWDFKELPKGSIALDGACVGPQIDVDGERFSFDHHVNCIRLITAATCKQVFDALLLGFDPSNMNVYVNDVDGDTVLSVWLLLNWRLWKEPCMQDHIRPLVNAVAELDAHGPAYPISRPDLTWHFYANILQPLHTARQKQKALDMEKVFHECLAKMEEWWKSGLIPESCDRLPVQSYKIKEYDGFILVLIDKLQQGFRPPYPLDFYEKGYDKLILCSSLPANRFRYVIARRSDFIKGYPLPEIYEILNQLEQQHRGHPLGLEQQWGGGSTVGGSPRDGSVLTPDIVAISIQRFLRETK